MDAHRSRYGAARVTRRPSRIVIAQAVVVVLLAVVVFITLLQPKGNSPLSGVQAPGAPRQTGLPAPGGYAGADEHNGGGGGRQTQPATPDGGGGGGGVVPPTTVPAPAAAPSAGGSEGAPAEDQYADTLARLNARLN
jgi:hypothetical protein